MTHFTDSPQRFTHNLLSRYNNQKNLMVAQQLDKDSELPIGISDDGDENEIFIYLNRDELDELIQILQDKLALMP